MKKIPNDLKKYTDESVKAVNDAKAAIVRGKNITEQKTVDGYAAALEKAIAGLKQKPMTAQNLPKITKGVNQSGMQGKELSFTADFEAKDLKKVLIDQKEIDAKNYVTAGKENTQVTLKAEYTKSLAEGKHTISIVSLAYHTPFLPTSLAKKPMKNQNIIFHSPSRFIAACMP